MTELLPSGFWNLDPAIPWPFESVSEVDIIKLERTGTIVDGRPSFTADCWAIRCAGRCYGRNGTWDFEPLPSSRTDDWLANFRWTYDEACAVLTGRDR